MNTQEQIHSNAHTPSAQESIAACKSLFEKTDTRKKLSTLWANLPPRFRGMICVASDMKASEYSRDFDSFDNEELKKIHGGMKQLKEMVNLFDRKVGDMRHIQQYQITRSH